MKKQILISQAFVRPTLAGLVLVSAAGAQVGGPPIPPSASALGFRTLSVHEGASVTRLLAVESRLDGRSASFYTMDAAGMLTFESLYDLNGDNLRGFGDDRMVLSELSPSRPVQVHERTSTGWELSYRLNGPNLTANITYGDVVLLDGQRLLVGDPFHSEVDIFDLSTPGTALLVDEISLPGGKIATNLAIGEGTLIVSAGVPQIVGAINVELLVYTDQGTGFNFESAIAPPSQFNLEETFTPLAATADRLAIGFPMGTTADPCGRVLVYDRLAGAFTQSAEIRDSGTCSLTVAQGTEFGTGVEFRGRDELLILGGSQRGARQYAHSAGTWTPGPRHLSNTAEARFVWTSGASYVFARDWVMGASPEGIQVFDNVSSIANDATVCSALIPAVGPEWALTYGGSYSLSDQGGTFGVNFEFGDIFGTATNALALMLIGSERNSVAFGVAANICVGGAVRRAPMDSSVTGSIVEGRFEFDPADHGVNAGETLFFQSWRRQPGIFGGATTNAVAITFIP